MGSGSKVTENQGKDNSQFTYIYVIRVLVQMYLKTRGKIIVSLHKYM
jgi:hypothetical protein